MAQHDLDRYQLAGLDPRERGFSRPVHCDQTGEQFRAVLRYESDRVATGTFPTPDMALLNLIQMLQALGYRQLKTQVSFRDGLYLGSRELWVEYPDPVHAEAGQRGILKRIVEWFQPRAQEESPR